jgi:hypothetical protein
VSWVTVFAGEEVLVVPVGAVPAVRFRLVQRGGRQDVELSLAGLQTKPGVFVTHRTTAA